MSSLLTAIGSVFTAAIGWVGDVVEVITASGNELLLIFCIIPLVGLGVGATIGAGIFSTISEVASVSGSSLMLVLAFFIGALFQIPCCFCYNELASAFPEDGGHYVYFREAGFKLLTFIIG